MDQEMVVGNMSNITINSQRYAVQLKVVDYVLLSLYSVLVVIGVIGNILVIRWFSSDEWKNRPGSFLVVVLAGNDLIASLVTTLNEMNLIVTDSITPQYIWYLGRGMCKCLNAFTYMLLLTTPWLLVAIATERFQ